MIVERIFTSPAEGATQTEHESVELVAGHGVRGDRYFGRCEDPGRNATLIEAEQIEGFQDSLGRPRDLSVTYRNFVTRGVRLNDLVGREFTVGGVRMLGIRLCEPCMTLGGRLTSQEITPAGVIQRMTHRGGLRASVLSSGMIAVGSRVLIDADSAAACVSG